MGHEIKWQFEPMSTDAIERMFQERVNERPRVNKRAIRLFVDELLKDEELNILWLPDIFEAEIYEHVMTIVLAMLEDIFHSVDLTVLGMRARLSLVNAVYKKEYEYSFL